jgi:hypothetical protein
MKSFWNPFTTYAIACIFVQLVYSIGFSFIYPPLSSDVVLFLFFSSTTAILFAFLVFRIPLTSNDGEFGRQHERLLAGFFIAGFAAEFAYFGGIPLLMLLSGTYVSYMAFGIPTFHVVLIGTSFFFSVYWWDCYLCTGSKRHLTISLFGMVATILMVSRGSFLIPFLGFIFAYGNRRGLRRKAKLFAVMFIAIIFGFGYLGEVRGGGAANGAILWIGGANDTFFNSGLPDVAFWFYLYVSSPLANFAYTALHRTSEAMQLIGFVTDFLPDFVSKHFITPEHLEEISTMRITTELTAGTAYARPLNTLGWVGPYALHAYFLAFFYLAISFARRSRYYGALLAIFSAQGCLMFFDNMLVFAGGIVPALVGLTLVFLQRLRLRSAKNVSPWLPPTNEPAAML